MQNESPDAMEGFDRPEPRWWRPGWGDVITTVGWRWFLLIAGTAGLALALSLVLLVGGLPFATVLFKPVLLLAGGAVALCGYLVRRAVQARREPFCVFCGYCLTGLPDDHRCPECGRPYTWEEIEEYRRDPQWFIERWKARRKLPPADAPVDTGPARPRRRSRDGTD